jgi:sugar lactone lactonase YvrE
MPKVDTKKLVTSSKQQLILGGGFAGIQVLKTVQKKLKNDNNIQITLVSRDNFLLFTPMLPEVASGMIETRHIVTPVRELCKKANFYEADVESIDFGKKQVTITHAIGRQSKPTARVDPLTEKVRTFPLPNSSNNANLNTATFDHSGVLWFTGQAGVYDRLVPSAGEVEIFKAPGGPGPYGITTTPDGSIYYASLAGNHIARIDLQTRSASVIEPPTPDQGARRIWSDSQGKLWVSEWNSGKLAAYNPVTNKWQEWRLPGINPMPYAVYVDNKDIVWLSDFGSNSIVRFDPTKQKFDVFTLPTPAANVRQILGRPGEIWGQNLEQIN